MTDKLITLDDQARNLVSETINTVTKAVTSTMGSNGKLALIGVGTSAKVTKDGVTVARSIKFTDPRQELINRVVVEAAIKADTECGDGTTTTVFLTHQLYNILTKYSSFKHQKFIEGFIDRVIKQLTKDSIKVNMDSPLLKQLALTSSNNDVELSELVTQIYKDGNGKFPEIEIKEGIEPTDRISRSSGLPLAMNFSNPAFSKNGNGDDTTYDNPIVIVIDSNVKQFDSEELVMGLNSLPTSNGETYLLVARSFENETNIAIAQVNNSLKKSYRVFVPLQTNMGGSVGTLLMQDLATVFNTPLIKTPSEIAVNKFSKSLDQVVVGNSRSLFNVQSDDTRVRIKERIALIESELNDYEGGERFSHRARFNERRIRNLNGELVTVFVGGETISDVKERVDRFEDVIKAVKSALVNGILPGMGTALINAGRVVFDEYQKEADLIKVSGGNKSIGGLLKDFLESTQYESIMGDLSDAIEAQRNKLISTSMLSDYDFSKIESEYLGDKAYTDLPPLCINLTTDETGTVEDLGIYDTAYASITALKGGFKTAKILANLDTVLLGDKLGAIKVN